MDAVAENRVARCNAGIDDSLRTDFCDGAIQLDVPPVDRRIEAAQEPRARDNADSAGDRGFRLQIDVAADNRVVAEQAGVD